MAYAEINARLVRNLLHQKSAGQIPMLRAGFATMAKLGVDILRQKSNFVLVVPDRESLQKASALLTLFSPELSSGEKTAGQWDSLPAFSTRLGEDRKGWAERIATLHALHTGKIRGILLTPESLLLKWMPRNFFEGQELILKKNEEIAPEMLLEQATVWGYIRVPMVANPGEIALRGNILDIMPPSYKQPLRLDFYNSLLESIRTFDPSTQRSEEDIDEALILPVSPVRRDAVAKQKIEERWKRLQTKNLISENEASGMQNMLEHGDIRLLPGAVYDAAAMLEEWLPKNAIWLLPGKHDLEDSLRAAEHNLQNSLSNAQPAKLTMRNAEQTAIFLEKTERIYAEPLALGVEQEGEEFAERNFSCFEDIFPTPEDRNRPWQTLVHALKSWKKRQIILSFATERSRKKFLNLARQDGIHPALRYNAEDAGLYALLSPFRDGAEILWDETLILGENVLQPHEEKNRRMPSADAFRGINRHDDLNIGDFLVHREYGIARFGGMLRMQIGNCANDFLLLEYADDDRLYLPVDRLSMVQRFRGEEKPQLDRLGSTSWQAGRDKARKAIEKIASDLVDMYAWRKVAKGFQYPPTDSLYREFEASFSFEETPDQAKAIRDVLQDMEKPEPMDRLICGDVGFGKTEVALRAAFRAASEHRQVALLCPTTVLAEQHYQTFRSRLAPFGINVGLLSRFVPAARQKEVLKAADAGQIDVLVGTHRLLSADVHLPNLALLILDEEQRFGVRHKEKIKEMRKNIDVLTLTATPIPRTLQLSMSGVRELSVIETAPADRKPVKTAILQRDDTLTLKGILERELARNGQIFWVYNRVQGIEKVADFARTLTPNARIAIAHGQLPEKKLEETMLAFWHGEIDILVCTAIVESGLDFPRANTLIVDQAQMFGLGQLYQLRGRVGRSDRQAFAGFIVPDLKSLPKTVQERLQLVLDLDYLGAGFQIAMEDLRLRGAGNILGEAQSGHMNRIGLDLYLEMLEQAVKRIRGDAVAQQSETEINLAFTASIPERYISSAQERLHWYKLLSSAKNMQEREKLVLEMRDRFGRLPDAAETFIAVLDLKYVLGESQVVRADLHADHARLVWDESQTAIDLQKLLTLLTNDQSHARLLPPATLELYTNTALPLQQRLAAIRQTVSSLRASQN